jgi:S1-C subfamily serine protease
LPFRPKTSRENGEIGLIIGKTATLGCVPLRLVSIVALVCAALGAAAALAVARATGWIGASHTQTVVIPAPEVPPPASVAAARSAAKPLTGNGFDPARIYAQRAAGVVTIYAVFAAAQESTQGSGFVVSSDGLILTNSHVITTAGQSPNATPRPADELYVEFADHDRVPAKIVGWDVFDDVGVLRIDPRQHGVTPVPLGSSAAVRVGDPVAVIGSPFGNENSLAVGVVSATRRSINSLTAPNYELIDAIQTDAPINHGNSGGPMFDARGRVVGISAQIRSLSGNAEGVAFAVPIDSARRSLRQLVADGRVHYAFVGIRTESLTPSIAQRFHYGASRGAIVIAVDDNTPAAAAGFEAATKQDDFEGEQVAVGGDVIVAIDGIPVRSADDVVRIVTEQLLPGQTARFAIVRGNARRTLAVRLAERPSRPSEQ